MLLKYLISHFTTLLSNATLIAAVAAFATLVYKNWYKKRAESGSVNNAVQAEIKRLLLVLSSHEKWWAERIRLRDTDQPLIPFSYAVYAGQVKNIGVLNPKTVDDVVRFYGNVDFINALQGQHGQYEPLRGVRLALSRGVVELLYVFWADLWSS